MHTADSALLPLGRTFPKHATLRSWPWNEMVLTTAHGTRVVPNGPSDGFPDSGNTSPNGGGAVVRNGNAAGDDEGGEGNHLPNGDGQPGQNGNTVGGLHSAPNGSRNGAGIPEHSAQSMQRSEQQRRVSESIERAANCFHGRMKETVLNTVSYVEEKDTELQQCFPGDQGVRGDLLSLTAAASNLQISSGSQFRVHVLQQRQRQWSDNGRGITAEELLVGRDGMPTYLITHHLLFSPTLVPEHPIARTSTDNESRPLAYLLGNVLTEGFLVAEEMAMDEPPEDVVNTDLRRVIEMNAEEVPREFFLPSETPCSWFPGCSYNENTEQGRRTSPHLEIGEVACRYVQNISVADTRSYYESFIKDVRAWIIISTNNERGHPFSYEAMTPPWIRRRMKLALPIGEENQSWSSFFIAFSDSDVKLPPANGGKTRNRSGTYLIRALLSAFYQHEPLTRHLLTYVVEHRGKRQYEPPRRRRRNTGSGTRRGRGGADGDPVEIAYPGTRRRVPGELFPMETH